MTVEERTIQMGMMTVMGSFGFEDFGAGVDTGEGRGPSRLSSGLGSAWRNCACSSFIPWFGTFSIVDEADMLYSSSVWLKGAA